MKSKTRNIAIGMIALSIVGSLIAAGGLLSFYGKIETTATVAQSVVIDGQTEVIMHDFDINAGCCIWTKHKLMNRACVEAPIEVVTDINGYGKGPDGVYVNYYSLPGWSTLRLENKNENWEVIDDEFYADVTYNPACPTFNGYIDGVFAPETEYVLIYYMDQPDRFVNWGGAPALDIVTFTSDVDGTFHVGFDLEVGEETLPFANDWNIGQDADYTQAPDNYAHGKGAKLWLVPAAIYDGIETELLTWVPDEILFETDLIVYADCNVEYPTPEVLAAYFEYEVPMTNFGITLASQEERALFIQYCFDVAIMGGEYGITTSVVPIMI